MFRAFDQQTERLVAVKLFTLDLAPERVHQLVAELDRLTDATLAHPAIASPLATGIHDNHAYLAMEYVSADSLDTAIRQYGAAPPADALRVAAQLAGALDFAAVVHVAHGALHPRDVLLSPEETRLTGLGIAAAFERIQVAAPVRRPYTPPEGIAGADWDRRADVFSLAALMHELLWGKRVSATGAQAGASLTQIPGADLVALRAVFARALAEQAADRFPTALEFAQALTMAFPDVGTALPRSGAGVSEPAPRSNVARDERGARLPLDEPLPIDTAPPPAPPVQVRPEPRPSAGAEASRPADQVAPQPTLPPPGDVDHAPDAGAADFDLREAEVARYHDVGTPSAMADFPPALPEPDGAVESPLASSSAYAEPPVSALERSRSALWPLALALVVGVAIGFASGYGVGNRDRNASASTAAAVPSPTASAPAAAQESSAAVVEPKATPGETPQKTPTTGSGTSSAASESTFAGARAPDAPAPPASEKAQAAARPGSAGKSDVARSDVAGSKSEVPDGKAGRLLVRSTPAGARVFVDGREEGRTPVAVRELARGEHRVRLVHDGYSIEERHVMISASRPAQSLTVPLSPTSPAPAARMPIPATPGTTGRFVGALSVDSRPSGAKVFVDGKLAGTTPLQLAGLDAGSHVVRIERDGYRRWSSAVRVVASEQNRVTAALEK